MQFEHILVEVGDYGKYQADLIKYFLIPTASLLPWFTMNILFMLSVPEHWCYVPEVASSNLSLEQQRALVSPPDNTKCRMYDANYTILLESNVFVVPNGTSTKPCDHGWQYDTTNYDSTAASKWDMVCDHDQAPSFIMTLFNVGSIIGTPIYGALSDKIGRKPVFFITIIITAISALSSVLMTNYTAFVVLKTINGSLMPSVFQLPFIIVLEIVSPEMRTRMNGLVNSSWTIGLCLLPLLAYLTRDWVLLGVISSSVCLVYLVYWKFLPESPRWLVSQERYEDACTIMVDIAKKNKMPVDKETLLAKLKKLGDKIKEEGDEEKFSPMSLLRLPRLRKKFLIVTFCWVADITAYYGLQLNIPNLGGNEFLNFFLLALAELPGYMAAWIFMQNLGRRWCTTTAFILTGISCFISSIVPSDIPAYGVVFSLFGKFFAAASFMSTYQQGSELYPTVIRSLGMGMSSTIAFLVTIPVPYIVYLSVYGRAIPFVIIGALCIAAGLSASFLPETLNESLPQTISDAEEFGKEQKFFSLNRRRQSVCHEHRMSLRASLGFLQINDNNDIHKKSGAELNEVKSEDTKVDSKLNGTHAKALDETQLEINPEEEPKQDSQSQNQKED